jgi:hypothetical protein
LHEPQPSAVHVVLFAHDTFAQTTGPESSPVSTTPVSCEPLSWSPESPPSFVAPSFALPSPLLPSGVPDEPLLELAPDDPDDEELEPPLDARPSVAAPPASFVTA